MNTRTRISNEPRLVLAHDRHAMGDKVFKILEAFNTIDHDVGSWLSRNVVQDLINSGMKVTIREYKRT